MKKSILFLAVVFCLAGLIPLAAATYDNNEYQRKSRAYSDLAVKAYDEGDYDAAVTYANEAEKNADLSAAFIEKMLARADAETLLLKAHTRFTWATEKKAVKNYPAAFATAAAAIESGDGLFAAEDYPGAKAQAEIALGALADVRDVVPLPSRYKVGPWESTRDCLWNIAKNPAIYGDPFMWKKLYDANRKSLTRPSDPDLLEPGMILSIPSIAGELREGDYDPSMKYEPFKKAPKK
jgi:nucleoid-associated protein YgaU